MSTKEGRLKDEGSKTQVVIAGATAGLISRFIIAPLDVVKIRLQLQSHSLSDPRLPTLDLRGGPTYRGTLPTLRHILRHEGLPGLWKGNVPAELMYVTYAAVQFSAYRSATTLLHTLPVSQRLSPAVESFVAGASAGAAATAVTYPLDLLRTRFAAQGPGERIYPSLRSAIPTILRDEGARGFFRGLGPALTQIVPFMGIFFASYESLRLVAAERLDLPWGGGDAAAGTVASVVAKTGVFPLDLVRKRIQVQGPTRERYVHRNIPEYKGWVQALGTIVRVEGVRGLYRGLVVSLVKAAPASAVTMWTYERVLGLLVGLEKGKEDKTV